jgi:hypothetical protein
VLDTTTRLRPIRVVVDLLYLTFTDSTGIGALVAGRNAACAVGVGFTMRHPSSFVAAAQLRQAGLYEALTTDRCVFGRVRRSSCSVGACRRAASPWRRAQVVRGSPPGSRGSGPPAQRS